MARRIREDCLLAIVEAVRQHPDGVPAPQIAEMLKAAPPQRTLQYRLKSLVETKRLVMEGSGRWARYLVPGTVDAAARVFSGIPRVTVQVEVLPPLTDAGMMIRNHVRRPLEAREPVGYDQAFLDSYRPNDTFHLSPTEREHTFGRLEARWEPHNLRAPTPSTF